MIKVEDYQVHKLAQEELHKFGFHNGVYKQWVYKKLIQLEIFISIENQEWYYQVVDTSHGELYSAYYDNEYGNNEVADNISDSVNKIINRMVKNKILLKVRR